MAVGEGVAFRPSESSGRTPAVRRGPAVEIELGDAVEGDRSLGARADGCTYAEQASRIHSATMKLDNFRVEGATPSKKSTCLVGPGSSLPFGSRVGFRCVSRPENFPYTTYVILLRLPCICAHDRVRVPHVHQFMSRNDKPESTSNLPTTFACSKTVYILRKFSSTSPSIHVEK
jgi:hypothetical protein